MLAASACSDTMPNESGRNPIAPKSPAVVPAVQNSGLKPRAQPVAKKVTPGAITGIDMGRVFTMTQSGQVLLIDCRPLIFYRMGHIESAINLPLKSYDSVIRDRKKLLDRAVASQQVIVLYCQNTECPDAYAIAQKLVKRGYSVSIYKGGWEEWKRAGF